MTKKLPREPLYTCLACTGIEASSQMMTWKGFIAHMETAHYRLWKHTLMQFAERVPFNEDVYYDSIEGKTKA